MLSYKHCEQVVLQSYVYFLLECTKPEFLGTLFFLKKKIIIILKFCSVFISFTFPM